VETYGRHRCALQRIGLGAGGVFMHWKDFRRAVRSAAAGVTLACAIGPWQMRVAFDPAAMAAGYDGVARYPTLQSRPMTPLR